MRGAICGFVSVSLAQFGCVGAPQDQDEETPAEETDDSGACEPVESRDPACPPEADLAVAAAVSFQSVSLTVVDTESIPFSPASGAIRSQAAWEQFLLDNAASSVEVIDFASEQVLFASMGASGCDARDEDVDVVELEGRPHLELRVEQPCGEHCDAWWVNYELVRVPASDPDGSACVTFIH